jgi:hypothetical protein
VTSQAEPVSPSLRPSIFQANAEANERGEAFRSDLRSCPTLTLVPGSPTEPQGSWTSLRGRAVAQPDLDNLEPIEHPTAVPYFSKLSSEAYRQGRANASSIAAADLGESVSSSISPVAIRMTLTALPITSAGRFSPRGPRGMFYRRGNL